jgi:hypothetical protein
MENNPQYPTPETPLSFREVLRKILDEPEYASFIHGEVQRARTAETQDERAEAASNIDAHFMVTTEELTLLDLASPLCSPNSPLCTATKANIRLANFATTTPHESGG